MNSYKIVLEELSYFLKTLSNLQTKDVSHFFSPKLQSPVE